MSAGHPEVDEREASRAEKLLAVGLVAFLLIGGFWILGRLASFVAEPDWMSFAETEGLIAHQEALRIVEADYYRAAEAAAAAVTALDRARAEYEYRKEEFRLAVELGHNLTTPRALYEEARAGLDTAREQHALTEAARASMETRLSGPRQAHETTARSVERAFSRARDRYELLVFLMRFGYALPLFAFSVWAWIAARRRPGRHLIVLTAFMAFAGLQAIGLVFQYGWYVLRDIGPIALSVTGSAVCLAGLAALRRWAANPKRLAAGRLRRKQCPFCGYPLAGDGSAYCSGCGRGLVEPCSECGRESLPETAFCPHCGSSRARSATEATTSTPRKGRDTAPGAEDNETHP